MGMKSFALSLVDLIVLGTESDSTKKADRLADSHNCALGFCLTFDKNLIKCCMKLFAFRINLTFLKNMFLLNSEHCFNYLGALAKLTAYR